MNRTAEQRFWAKVDKTGECWLWTASLTSHGYGQFYFDGRPVAAHRFSYELFSLPIPAGMDVDHTCRIRACVNPFHLRLVFGILYHYNENNPFQAPDTITILVDPDRQREGAA